jgi:hypothetical protein
VAVSRVSLEVHTDPKRNPKAVMVMTNEPAGHLFILFSPGSGAIITGKICYRAKTIGVAAVYDQRRFSPLARRQFPAPRVGAMDVFLVSFLCGEFEARPMPENFPRLTHLPSILGLAR